MKSNEIDGTKRNFIYLRNNIRSQNILISLVQVKFVLFSILEARNWSLLYSSWSKRLLDTILRGSHQFRKGAFGTRLSPMVTAKIYYIPKNWFPQTNVYIHTHNKDCLSQRRKKYECYHGSLASSSFLLKLAYILLAFYKPWFLLLIA